MFDCQDKPRLSKIDSPVTIPQELVLEQWSSRVYVKHLFLTSACKTSTTPPNFPSAFYMKQCSRFIYIVTLFSSTPLSCINKIVILSASLDISPLLSTNLPTSQCFKTIVLFVFNVVCLFVFLWADGTNTTDRINIKRKIRIQFDLDHNTVYLMFQILDQEKTEGV